MHHGGTAHNNACKNACKIACTILMLSLGHQASGVHGRPGPESMYSMNWVTYSFMRVRHVSIQGTLRGGGGAICSYCTRYAVV